MKNRSFARSALCAAAVAFATGAGAAELCQGYGPQTPRDISSTAGTNARAFTLAPPSSALNLCNIHYHENAEHKGPGFSVFAGKGKYGGYKCAGSDKLTKAELTPPKESVCKNLNPGDTIEVHWVFSSCDVKPGKGLGACLSEACANPQLRVESQVFLVVNDKKAANFVDFAYGGNVVNGLHQPKSLPTGDAKPVVFRGSTTGPSYTQSKCSPLQVTWSVRPACAKIDISTVHNWCKKNAFKEDHAHGVRQLVTAPELLDKIQ